VGVKGAQVRKDFSFFNIAGRKRGGYKIDSLIENINHIFKKDKTHNVILVGAGNLGNAFMKYPGFKRDGIHIMAAFDIDPVKYQKKLDFPILPLSNLKEFVEINGIKIGIIAVPEIAAQEVLDRMIEAGIEGVLNFAPCSLRYPERVITVTNVNLEQELEGLIYFVDIRKKIYEIEGN
jgi:redox-sensing transcriptional repressor